MMASTTTDGYTLPIAPTNGYAQAADWELHRDTIARLYVEENRPLKEVRAFMQLQLGFRAT
jgi:Clr5 domain